MAELMKLQELFEKRLDKIKELEEFISLYGEKSKIIDKLRELSNKTAEQHNLLEECTAAVQHFKTVMYPQYKVILKKMQNMQLMMLEAMQKLEEQEPVATPFSNKSIVNEFKKENVTPAMSNVRKWFLRKKKKT